MNFLEKDMFKGGGRSRKPTNNNYIGGWGSDDTNNNLYQLNYLKNKTEYMKICKK